MPGSAQLRKQLRPRACARIQLMIAWLPLRDIPTARISVSFTNSKRADATSTQPVEVLGDVAGLAATDAEVRHRVAGDDLLGVHDPAAERPRQVRQHPGDVGAVG